ncbi:WD40 repeat-containing protein [Heterostelium album PN500]|uniref:WD40 repeat-containing protein n=1 Tax=Heterostelium pallidum (strain ATCC 26659 / Pp 5 / PN500) TaxID=670386 RepID=D3BTY6_HETP5|nr:WD40 repeat-containing protein [Heterostelium album PN500]EFA75172.1 WD40 repeat-containing protein [Heterostelium album PN500]|eukprot:XP_020427306.1 WD40 repeat-containing protein [Heterostelium album PN500]
MFGSTLGQQQQQQQKIEVANPPSDGITSLKFSSKNNYLTAGSWDKQLRVWEVTNQPQAAMKAMINYEAPILCTDWSPDCFKIYAGGCDNKAKVWDLQSNTLTQVAQHNAPIKELFWIEESKVLVTGSWDKTLKYWDLRSPQPVLSVDLPERVYALDVLHPLLVVGTADRKVKVYNLSSPGVEFSTIEPPLKFQTRCVSCFPDRTGFAMGSIEGRVAIQYITDDKQSEESTPGTEGDNAYSVNSIAFAQPYGTFATAGSDGTFNFWDKENKNRLKQFPKLNNTISAACFNPEATLYAYALSYDWSKGVNGYDQNSTNTIQIQVVQEADIKGRGKNPKKAAR